MQQLYLMKNLSRNMDKQTAQWINALVQIIGEKVLEGGNMM